LLSIPVAPVAVIAVLKMIAYLDRPGERERDLHDLAYILENHVSPDDERRFADDVLDAGIPYERAGAYLLVHDLRQLVSDTERTAEKTPFGNCRVTDVIASLVRILCPATRRARLAGRPGSAGKRDCHPTCCCCSIVPVPVTGLRCPVPSTTLDRRRSWW